MSDWTNSLLDHLLRPLHMYRGSRVDLEQVRTLGFGLGPNRNMTTLTAGLLALHPQVQVLNHAWGRQQSFAKALLDEGAEEKTFEAFVRSAVVKSQGGRQGRYGGSVTHSHAFKRPAMKDAYEKRYGSAVLKDDIRSVYWKSAKQVTVFVRDKGIDLGDVVKREPRLRFLMPLRNPLDCARSNFRKGHHRTFKQLRDQPVEAVIDFMTELVGWFLDLRRDHPEHFFGYLETEFDRPMLERLAAFLQLDVDEQWLADVLQSKAEGSPYEYDASELEAYKRALDEHLSGHPDVQQLFAARAGIA
jgi:hypothetical protein